MRNLCSAVAGLWTDKSDGRTLLSFVTEALPVTPHRLLDVGKVLVVGGATDLRERYGHPATMLAPGVHRGLSRLSP